MRTKEHAHDYRYFPDPDLLPIELSEARIAEWAALLPELPAAKAARFVADYQIPAYDAGVLVADRGVADYFEEAAKVSGKPKEASNWVMGELMRLLTESGQPLSACRCPAASLGAVIRMVDDKSINRGQAKELFALLFAEGGDPAAVAKQRGMVQVSDAGELEKWVDEAIAANPNSVADYKAGKKAALQHLMGQTMRLSKGKANPAGVSALLARKLG